MAVRTESAPSSTRWNTECKTVFARVRYFSITPTNLSSKPKSLGCVAIILATMVIGVDLSMLNVALPTVARVFSATEAQLQWIVAAYTLVFSAGMLPAGS